MKSFLAFIIGLCGLIGIIITGLAIMVGAIIVIGSLEHITYPYYFTAEYCYPNGSDCSYIQDHTDSSNCPEWYDPQVIIGPMGDMKLKDGTCKVSKG